MQVSSRRTLNNIRWLEVAKRKSSALYTAKSYLGIRCFLACPANFTQLRGFNKCFKLESEQLVWYDAKARCRSLHPDAHLIVVNDALAQAAAVSYVNDMRGLI